MFYCKSLSILKLLKEHNLEKSLQKLVFLNYIEFLTKVKVSKYNFKQTVYLITFYL